MVAYLGDWVEALVDTSWCRKGDIMKVVVISTGNPYRPDGIQVRVDYADGTMTQVYLEEGEYRRVPINQAVL